MSARAGRLADWLLRDASRAISECAMIGDGGRVGWKTKIGY
jgi:hypothetical protein